MPQPAHPDVDEALSQPPAAADHEKQYRTYTHCAAGANDVSCYPFYCVTRRAGERAQESTVVAHRAVKPSVNGLVQELALAKAEPPLHGEGGKGRIKTGQL